MDSLTKLRLNTLKSFTVNRGFLNATTCVWSIVGSHSPLKVTVPPNPAFSSAKSGESPSSHETKAAKSRRMINI